MVEILSVIFSECWAKNITQHLRRRYLNQLFFCVYESVTHPSVCVSILIIRTYVTELILNGSELFHSSVCFFFVVVFVAPWEHVRLVDNKKCNFSDGYDTFPSCFLGCWARAWLFRAITVKGNTSDSDDIYTTSTPARSTVDLCSSHCLIKRVFCGIL